MLSLCSGHVSKHWLQATSAAISLSLDNRLCFNGLQLEVITTGAVVHTVNINLQATPSWWTIKRNKLDWVLSHVLRWKKCHPVEVSLYCCRYIHVVVSGQDGFVLIACENDTKTKNKSLWHRFHSYGLCPSGFQ